MRGDVAAAGARLQQARALARDNPEAEQRERYLRELGGAAVSETDESETP